MIKINKKSNVTFVFAITIVSIIGFFVMFNFFINTSSIVSSEAQDLLCKSLVATKDLSKLGIGVFMYELNNKCKVDEIKNVYLSKNKREDSFKKIGDEMNRCWNRYGKGEYDFLSEWDSEGTWCFECGRINLKDNSQLVKFNEFVDWTQNNYIKQKKGKEKKSYFDNINIKYTKVSNDKVLEIRKEFKDLVNDPNGIDTSIKPLIGVLGNQINYLDDLRTKTLNSNDKKLYVVYRFDRISKNYNQQLNDAKDSATNGALIGVFATIGTEMATEAVVFGAGGAIFGGVGAIPGAIIGSVVGFVKGTYKVVTLPFKVADKLLRISILVKKTKNLIKSSKFSAKTTQMVKIGYDGSKNAIKISKKIVSFKASKKDIEELSKIADKSGDLESVQNLNTISTFMDAYNIKNLAGINKLLLKKTKDLNSLEKIIKSDSMFTKLSNKAVSKQKDVLRDVNVLTDLRKLALEEVSKAKKGVNIPEPIGIRNYLRLSVIISGGLAGAYLGDSLNSNYQQYVDILTREQYYRQCGTQRFSK